MSAETEEKHKALAEPIYQLMKELAYQLWIRKSYGTPDPQLECTVQVVQAIEVTPPHSFMGYPSLHARTSEHRGVELPIHGQPAPECLDNPFLVWTGEDGPQLAIAVRQLPGKPLLLLDIEAITNPTDINSLSRLLEDLLEKLS